MKKNKEKTHDLFARIDLYSKEHNLIPAGARILLGLSGGPDSVLLFYYLQRLHDAGIIQLGVAHPDHEWRTSSVDDYAFCEQLAQRYDIPFYGVRASELSINIPSQGSQEAQGRILRRHFLSTVAQQEKYTHIALAHHADDQLETFFLRLIRGATISGLRGMRPEHGTYIRPLLCVRKQEILVWLDEHQKDFQVDPTNESDLFLRNRIRDLIAMGHSIDARFVPNALRAIEQIGQADDLLAWYTEQTYMQVTKQIADKQCLDLALWHDLHPHMRERVLMQFLLNHGVPFTPTEGFLQEIMRFLNFSADGIHALHAQWSIEKKKGYACVVKKEQVD